MPADLARLPATVTSIAGEAIDSHLERLAAVNGMTNPQLLRRVRTAGATTAFLTIAPDPGLITNLAALSDVDETVLQAEVLSALPGIDTTGLNPADRGTWRKVAARGWPPEHGTALCPNCLAEDQRWRLPWRHPWVTACTRHQVWLLSSCPTCGRRFRSHRTALRAIDAPAGTCGNPAGGRGRNCAQPLAEVRAAPASPEVLVVQERIDHAIGGGQVRVVGALVDPDTYLGELKALTVLLLHLATQPGGDQVVAWADLARTDRDRSAGERGARWGLAPPADLVLRGSVLAAADTILRHPAADAAADALQEWTDLVPDRREGQLGWLADHTTMTPTLTRLIMAATATRRRITTLLDQLPEEPLPIAAIPQVVPAVRYAEHVSGMLDVAGRTGRLFAAICLARRHAGARSWAEAATMLGLPAETGVRTARACSGDLLVGPDAFVTAVDALAGLLVLDVDYRAREGAVRLLAATTAWYRPWARVHHPGSHDTSRGYAVAWLWTEYAHGHLDTSPAWRRPPDHLDRARYRRYAARLSAAAKRTLVTLAGDAAPADRRTT